MDLLKKWYELSPTFSGHSWLGKQNVEKCHFFYIVLNVVRCVGSATEWNVTINIRIEIPHLF